MLKYLLIGMLLMFGQDTPMTDDEYAEWRLEHWEEIQQVEHDRRATLQGRAKNLLITVKAQYGDGTPARGYISCDGYWCKYGGGEPVPDGVPGREPDGCGPNLPFKTDARGACVFNPPSGWLDENDESWMTCYATAGVRSGKLSFPLYDGGIYVITIPGTE